MTQASSSSSSSSLLLLNNRDEQQRMRRVIWLPLPLQPTAILLAVLALSYKCNAFSILLPSTDSLKRSSLVAQQYHGIPLLKPSCHLFHGDHQDDDDGGGGGGDINMYGDGTMSGGMSLGNTDDNDNDDRNNEDDTLLAADLNRWFEDRNQQPERSALLTDDDDDDYLEDEEDDQPLIPVGDFKWFEPTLRELEHKYDKRRELLNLSLDTDRLSTPLTVPENSNEMMELVLHEEFEKEIKEALEEGRIERQRRRDAELLAQQERVLAATAGAIAESPPQQQQQQQLDPKQKRKQALQEAQAAAWKDPEELILDRIEATVSRGPIASETKQQIDEQIAGFRRRLEQQPQDEKIDNYADWKKYQEIKNFEKEQNGVANEAEIRRKFLDWKAFMAKQELTMQAFAKEEKAIGREVKEIRQELPQQQADFSEVVANINRKALEALESVLQKRIGDGADTSELEARINKLRESLEAVDYVDIKPRSNKKKKKVFNVNETVDLTDVFPRQAKKKEKGSPKEKVRSRREEFASAGEALRQDFERRSLEAPVQQEDVPVKEIDYYRSEDELDDEEEEEFAPPPPPNTAFFAVDDDGDDDDQEYKMSDSDINKAAEERSTTLLGSYEDQKLENLFRQGKANSMEKRQEVKRSYEEFQMYQEEMMKKYEAMDESSLGYDLSDVLTDDGDIDAEKVLSYLKTKPLASTAGTETSSNSTDNVSSADDGRSTLVETTSGDPVQTMNMSSSYLGGLSPTSEGELISNKMNISEQYLSDIGEQTVAAKPKFKEPTTPPLSFPDAKSTADVEDVETTPPPPPPTLPVVVSGKSDINVPAEERETQLLGTYEDQVLRNLYRESGLTDKEEQEEFKEQYQKFQQYQEEAMKNFESEGKEEEVSQNEPVDTLEGSPQKQEGEALIKERIVKGPKSKSSDPVELGPKPSLAERKRRLKEGNTWMEAQPVESTESDDDRGNFLGQVEVGMDTNESVDAEVIEDEESSEDFEENKRRIEEALGYKRSRGTVDIMDALGKRPGDVGFDDDYKKDEYMFPIRKSDVDLSSYLSRKNMLLAHNSLSIMEVNSVMDIKDSVEMEGASPYMARINKPFREFGAIFRLEGVLADISELEFRAWYQVANELKLKPPSKEEARLASVQTPEYAVSRIFYWTNDYQQGREIGKMHAELLKKEVKESIQASVHVDSAGRIGTMPTPSETITVPEEQYHDEPIVPDAAVVLEQQRELTKTMYNVFAEKYGLRKPTEDELGLAALLTPAQAVEDIFEWARDSISVDGMVSELKSIYDAERRARKKAEQAAMPRIMEPQVQSAAQEQTSPDIVLVDGAVSWIEALQEVEMGTGLISNHDDEVVNMLLESTGLSRLFPPDKRVTASNNYSRDTYQQLGASLRIDRRPDMCVVFDGNSDSLMASRDNEMKSIGMTLIYPSYELLAADATSRTFEYLTAMNIRRLFGDRDNHEPMLEIAMKEPDRPQRKLMTIYPDDAKGEWFEDGHVEEGYENDDYDDFYYEDARYYDQDRYYGDDKYQPRHRDANEDGVLYDEETGDDLFQ